MKTFAVTRPTSDGAPEQIEADYWEMGENGALVFRRSGVAIAAFAPGQWAQVILVKDEVDMPPPLEYL